jgi:arylsulfatase A-like enzyme
MFSHGNTLYEEVIHVPLLVRLPQRTSRRVEEPVTIAGLAPAILRQVGMPIPEEFAVPPLSFDASDGSGYALAELPQATPTYLRYHRRAIVGRAGKLVVQEDGSEVLFDLASDPGESRALPDAPFAAELRKAMAHAVGGHPMDALPRGAPVDDATRARLRALGYAD